MIEEASGEEFTEFMKKNVFDALGMSDTKPDFSDTIILHRSRQYRRNAKGQLVNAPHVGTTILPTPA